MSNFRISFLFVILFAGTSLYSQAPGYLGKRLFLEGGIKGNLSLFNSSDPQEELSQTKLINPIVSLSLNWVSSRYRYVSLEASYFQSHLEAPPLQSFPGQPALKYRVSTQSIGIGFFRTSRKNGGSSLAPLGPFLGYKFNYAKAFVRPVRYVENNERFDGVEKAAFNLNYRTPELSFIGVSVSFGNRYIIKDKITLKYAFDVGYNFALDDSYDDFDRQLVIEQAELREATAFIFALSVGTGLLLY